MPGFSSLSNPGVNSFIQFSAGITKLLLQHEIKYILSALLQSRRPRERTLTSTKSKLSALRLQLQFNFSWEKVA